MLSMCHSSGKLFVSRGTRHRRYLSHYQPTRRMSSIPCHWGSSTTWLHAWPLRRSGEKQQSLKLRTRRTQVSLSFRISCCVVLTLWLVGQLCVGVPHTSPSVRGFNTAYPGMLLTARDWP